MAAMPLQTAGETVRHRWMAKTPIAARISSIPGLVDSPGIVQLNCHRKRSVRWRGEAGDRAEATGCCLPQVDGEDPDRGSNTTDHRPGCQAWDRTAPECDQKQNVRWRSKAGDRAGGSGKGGCMHAMEPFALHLVRANDNFTATVVLLRRETTQLGLRK